LRRGPRTGTITDKAVDDVGGESEGCGEEWGGGGGACVKQGGMALGGGGGVVVRILCQRVVDEG